MRRVFWLAVGAAVGVVVVRKLTATAERLTPQGAVRQAGRSAAKLGDAIRSFGEEIRAGMAEREDELRAALTIPDQAAHGSEAYDGFDEPYAGAHAASAAHATRAAGGNGHRNGNGNGNGRRHGRTARHPHDRTDR